MRLSDFAAEPRAVMLGGGPRMVAKLRLRDLAYLEEWMAGAIPEPGPGEEELPGGWPPTFQTEAGLALIGSGEGIARLAFASLRQTVAGFTLEDARAVAWSMAADELGPFYAALFPAAAEEAGPARGPRPPVNWLALIQLVAGNFGYTPDQILDLKLDQLFGLTCKAEASRGGGRQEWDEVIRDPARLEKLWRRAKAARKGSGEGQTGEVGDGR